MSVSVCKNIWREQIKVRLSPATGTIDEQGVSYDLQYGFSEKRSCETQHVLLIEELPRNASVGKQTDLILLNFSKAFDKVNHSKLL